MLTLRASASANFDRNQNPLFPVTLAIAALSFLRRRSRPFVLLAAINAVSLTLLGGCGGGSQPTSPKPVTSTITVTAMSRTLQHSATVLLTVN
jgi:hypothetical protein